MLEYLRWFRFGVGNYAFYLLLISAGCFALERIFPWRKTQAVLRKGFFQDLAFLALNGHVLGVLFWRGKSALWDSLGLAPFFQRVEQLNVLAHAPLLVQVVVLVVAKDFVEFWVHRLLHRVPWLWEFHKVHHSIEELDWMGNFRFHWMETFVYQFITYVPLAIFGFSGSALMTMAVFTTIIGHLNHSNLPISWGPLRYLFNSPKMHVWHHDHLVRGNHGQNFAIVFSAWDWLFRTAYMPQGQPAKLGFDGLESFPVSLPGRLLHPLGLLKPKAIPKVPPAASPG